MLTRHILTSLVGAVALLGGTSARAADEISVMTQNQYLGADLMPILSATTPGAFNDALVAALEQIAGNSFPDRARRQADDIAARMPHLVGLQEVWSLSCVNWFPETPQGQGCTDPSIANAFTDHLAETLTALSDVGATYTAVATVTNLDFPGIPFLVNGVPAVLIGQDRDVILARDGVAAAPVAFPCAKPSADGCNYEWVIEAMIPDGPTVPVERGYVAVDATIEGQAYRFANTHLEVYQPDPTQPATRFFQAAQANELLWMLISTTPPTHGLVVVGDFNSTPEDQPLGAIVPPYLQFTGTGFTDAWTMRAGDKAGYTCCQLEDLSNQKSLLGERIDMIFSFDPLAEVKQARVVGATVSDRTPPPGLGLWPSDHGGVVADLMF